MHRKIDFTGPTGHVLSGAIDLPTAGRPRAVALFAHCFTCSKDSHAARRIAMALADHGIATMRFDFTGLGASGGSFAESHFSANVADLVAAATALADDIGAPSLLIGHSLGGAAVIAAAADLPQVKAVVTLGAPFDVGHALDQLHGGDLPDDDGPFDVSIGGRPFTVDRAFIQDMRSHDQGARLAKLGRALLVMHSVTDATVGIDNARQIFEAARHPKSFVTLDRADHLLNDPADAAYVAAIIAAWAERYVPLAAPERPELAEGVVRVETAGGKFLQDIYASGHHLLGDEPIGYGGSNLGPTPYDLLLAALGTCTSMTIKLVADREGIPLSHVAVDLSHQRCHSADCADQGEGKPKLDVIDRVISLEGPLDEAQRARLLAIADRCPVHRTLENHPVIRTSLSPG